jgi:cyclopropane fatty-acyl-phospholipid synthase-like methyltransferase
MIADDKKTLVARGYDEIADAYIDRFGKSSVRATKLAEVVAHLSAGASVLDLGCGAGVPVARDLILLRHDDPR